MLSDSSVIFKVIILKSVLLDSNNSIPKTLASTVTLLSSPNNDFIFMGSSLISLPSKLLGFFPSLLTFFSVGALVGSFSGTCISTLSNSF